ncbi:MAG: hypothetical protein Tsb0018_09180 [Opitutales bacterium]|tara:strand:+ start:1248 stop:1481 length:234 start_codon:yes stop_codon:yes gene_type:complete
MAEKLTVVDMEKQLREDPNGNYKRGILDKLSAYKQELRQQIDQGHEKATHEALSQFYYSVEQAEVVVESYWAANNTI